MPHRARDAEAAPRALPALEPIALATVEDAERLLDAVAAHAERPSSMWGCCGGVHDGRYYYCDSCNLYYHNSCQQNKSRGREKPLCPACHDQAVAAAGGPRAKRRRPV